MREGEARGRREDAANSMRVLIVHNDYAKPSGEEHAVRAIAGLLTERGHEVAWFRKSSAGLDSLADRVRAFFSGIYSIAARSEMAALLDRQRMDLVQVQNLYPLISPSVLGLCRKRGLPVVMRCPNYRLFCPTGLHVWRGGICERCLYERHWWCVLRNCADGVMKSTGYAIRSAVASAARMFVSNVDVFIVLSEFQKRRFAAGGIPEERIAVVPNIVDTAGLPDRSDAGHVVGFVGRLSPEKGVRQFIEAARLLREYRFAVAGDISDMPGVARGAPANVRFLGFLSGGELREFYANARIIVVPSLWYEGFPNALGTAMGMGKAVVASRLGALPEIVDDGTTGLLFEAGRVDDLAEKIDWLWKRPELCSAMGQAAREKVAREYSPGVCYGRLIRVYEKATRLAEMRGSRR